MVLCSANSGEGATSLVERLKQENGNPFRVEVGRDPDALERLRQLSGHING